LIHIKECKLSVVVPSYNSHPTIKKCIESLLKQEIEADYEIIVVDSSSDEGVAEILKEFPEVKLYRFRKRLNAGQARNIGTKASRGDIIAFIDSDCVAPENWLKRILDDFNRYPQICGVFGVYTGGRSLLEKICGGEFRKQSGIGFCKGFIEGNCAFKREVFEKGCSWSERTRSQYVDLAKCIRLKVGKPVLWDSDLKVLHLGRVTWRKLIKSGMSKFEEDKKSKMLMAKSLAFSLMLLVGFASFLYYLATMDVKALILSISPNIPLMYYALRDRMLSFKYRIVLLPYLVWIRWVFWFGWFYACMTYFSEKQGSYGKDA